MRIAVAALGACLLAAFTAPTSENNRKDRAAMMIYDGRDRVVALLPYADSANLALILLTQMHGDSVARPQLAGRPCVGVALFSNREWAQLTASGRKTTDIRPSEATMRLRVYPATKDARVAVENILDGTAYVAVGVEYAQDPRRVSADAKDRPIKWPVQTYLDGARGPCTAE